jgi:hypothetical protein
MKVSIFFCCLFVISLNLPAQPSILGDWNGVLDVQGVVKLRIVFHLTETDGKIAATLDSPDQGAFGLPVTAATYNHPDLSLDMKNLSAAFKGTVKDDFSEINGTFTQGGQAMPLVLGRTAAEPVVRNRPQEPKPPFPYYEEEVTFENKTAGITLAGTLTLPKKEGKFPVVALVSGSGPQDRNEEIKGLDHKIFLVLADHLTRQGIGVLRYDDRGVGASGGKFQGAISADFAGDALAAVNYLKTRPEAAVGKIGIVGHSEGSMIAPMAAAQSKDVHFIVLLAGPGTPCLDLLLKQIELISRANGEPEDKIARTQRHNRELFQLAITGKDTAQLRQELAAMMQRQFDELPEADKKDISDPQENIKSSVDEMLDPWFRYFLAFDPSAYLTKVKCPVLAVNGTLDLQVPCDDNLAAIETALKKGGNKNYRVKALPNLNHLFQTCKTGSPSEYGLIEETFSPVALEEVSGWILEITK